MSLRIAIPIFDGITPLDAIGPFEVLARVPHARVDLIAATRAPIRAGGGLVLTPTVTVAELPAPDIIVVPGGPGVSLDDDVLLKWLTGAHQTARLTASVCTGALLLARAGILVGVQATTHWKSRDRLAALGAVVVTDRVVRRIVDGHVVITGAGVASGIDLALHVAAELSDSLTAEAIQLQLEYAPDPPFASGDPATARREVIERNAELWPAPKIQ